MKTDPVQNIIKTLEEIVRLGYEPWMVYESWLESCVTALTQMRAVHAHQLAHDGVLPISSESAEAQAVWQRLSHRFAQHWPTVHAFFGKALAQLVIAADGEWNDWLGQVFMQWNLGSHWKGQFFSPWHIAVLMAHLTTADIPQQVHDNIQAALRKSPAGQLALMGALLQSPEQAEQYFMTHVLPAAMPFVEPVTLYEPAIGSGGMFLAVASLLPPWMVALGLVTFAGQDIDQKCVWMCQIQFALYNLRGAPIRDLRWNDAAPHDVVSLTAIREELPLDPQLLEQQAMFL